MSRKHLWIFALAPLLALGCTGRTEVVLGVATDLKARGQLDNVELVISRDGVPIIRHAWPLADVPAGIYELPGSFGIYSPDGSEPRVQIDISGTLDDNPVADRQSILSLVSGQTLFTRMTLVSDCTSLDGPGCSSTETCIEGVCRPMAVDAHTFPVFTPPLVDHIACQSGTQFIVSSTGETMPLLPGSTGCGANQFCQEGTCYNLLRGQDAAVETGVWTDQGAPVTDVLHAVWQSADGQDLYTVGDAGTILHLTGGPTTGASSWTKEPSGTLANLYGVWGSSADDVWVVGTLYGSPSVSPPPEPASGVLLHKVAGVWSAVAAPTTASLHGLGGTGSSDVWAVGLAIDPSPAPGASFTDGSPAILHYDGSSWINASTLVSASEGGPSGELLAIADAGLGNVTAVGRGGLVVSSVRGLFTSTIVAPSPSGAPVDLTGVVQTAAGDLTVVGRGGLVGRLEGGSFTAESAPVSGDLFAISATSSTDLVAVGDYGVILRGSRSTTAGGTTWTAERSGTSAPLFAVTAGAQAEWVVGRSGTVRALTSTLPGSCGGDGDCPGGYYCAASATCQLQKPAGGAVSCDTRAGHDCFGDGCRECASGVCVDGYCCDRACDGTCEACDVKGSEGTCSTAPAGPVHPGYPFPYTSPSPLPSGAPSPSATPLPTPLRSCGTGGCTGTCDGKIATTCTFPSGNYCAGVPCVYGGGATPAALSGTCDGKGACSSASTCGLYTICNANDTACAANCQNESDCITGYYCDYTGGPSFGVGSCALDLANGLSCEVGSDGETTPQACQSSFCAFDNQGKQNVCCNTACQPTCATASTLQQYSCTGGTCNASGTPTSCAPYNCDATDGSCFSLCHCPGIAPTSCITSECADGYECNANVAAGNGVMQGSCFST